MASDPDFTECDSCLCFAARRAARTITQHYERHLRGTGLRATQFTLLTVLARAGELPMTELSEYLGMERTTLTRNLRPLLTKKYVTTGAGDDRRVRNIAITPQGLAILRTAFPLWRQAQRAMARRLPSQTLQVLNTAAEAV